MNLYKKARCADCGKETSLLARTKLHDKSIICRKCAKKVPSYIRKDLKRRYTIQDYKNLLQYVAYSQSKLKPLFHATNSYYEIQLDRENGLFCFDHKINEKTLIFRLDKVITFDLGFKADGYKDGFSGIYVHGKVIIGLEMEDPYLYHEAILAAGVRAPAKKIMYNTKISYNNPPGMDEFLELFLQACYESRQAAANREEITQYSPFINGAPSDLQQAMALFMIDRVEDLTPERIRAQRNRLIKAFHPDKGEVADDAYAQKINNAYETLIKYTK